MKSRILIGLFLSCAGIALIVSGIALTQYHQALISWQAESVRLHAEAERLQTLAESDYYRGVLSSCVGIGLQMGLPREIVSGTCTRYWQTAYEGDWYHELQVDSWQWPPEKPVKALGHDS